MGLRKHLFAWFDAMPSIFPSTTFIHINFNFTVFNRILYIYSAQINLYVSCFVGSAGFAHIGAVTVEFFHMLMNIQDKLIFKHLYNPESAKEPATMVGQIERRHRRSVKPKAMDAFHANKDFLESYFSTYIVEAALQFFGMESVNSIPTLNACNQHEDKAKWVTTTLAKFVDTYVFPWWTGQSKETVEIGKS